MALSDLLQILDEPNRTKCLTLWGDNKDRFAAAAGSSHNHQAWPGGYLDHLEEAMSAGVLMYQALSVKRPLPFTLSSVLLVLFLHDLEKPWRDRNFKDKYEKKTWRLALVHAYNFELTPDQENALMYVEGEGDDYRGDRRVMGELAAFCHICDVVSARIWHDEPKKHGALIKQRCRDIDDNHVENICQRDAGHEPPHLDDHGNTW